MHLRRVEGERSESASVTNAATVRIGLIGVGHERSVVLAAIQEVDVVVGVGCLIVVGRFRARSKSPLQALGSPASHS